MKFKLISLSQLFLITILINFTTFATSNEEKNNTLIYPEGLSDYSFKNLLLTLDKSLSEEKKFELIKNAIKFREENDRIFDTGGIAIHGFLSRDALHFINSNIRSFYTDEIIYLGHNYDDVGVYFIPYSSTAPTTILQGHQPHILSSCVVNLVEKDKKFYFIVAKDKSKPIATIPGGTMNRNEAGNFLVTAAREFFEETSSYDNGLDGMLLEQESLQPILTMYSHRDLLGLRNIPDECRIYGYTQEPHFSESLTDLFEQGILGEDGTYLLPFQWNSEIEWIAAIPIPDSFTVNSSERFCEGNEKFFWQTLDQAKQLTDRIKSPDGSSITISLFSRLNVLLYLRANERASFDIEGSKAEEIGLARPKVDWLRIFPPSDI